MKKKVYLDENLDYYIYGAGTWGKIIGNFLKQVGFCIKAYIDKRAIEIDTLNEVPVILPEYLKECNANDICIVIAIKDVFEHEKIKDALLGLGINKVIYRALGVLDGNGTEVEKEISRIYDSMADYSFKKYTLLPLITNEESHKEKREWILQETEDSLVMYIPCELVYTNYDERDKYTWGNVCIHALVPHIELFRFFSGNQEYSESVYIEFCIQNAVSQGIEVTDSWKKNVLRNRNNVFRQMFYYWSMDRGFFIRSAPTAEWNDAGFFNLTSGKHRVAFLVAMNQRWIPCRISKDDYKKWKNEAKLSMEHPLIMNPRNNEYQFWKDILAVIEFYICKLSLDKNCKPNYRGKRFYSNSSSGQYIERNLIKFGLEVVNNEIEVPLEEETGKLSGSADFPHVVDIEQYDFGFIDYRSGNYSTNKFIKCEFALLEEMGDESMAQNEILIYKNYYDDHIVCLTMKHRDIN